MERVTIDFSSKWQTLMQLSEHAQRSDLAQPKVLSSFESIRESACTDSCWGWFFFRLLKKKIPAFLVLSHTGGLFHLQLRRMKSDAFAPKFLLLRFSLP